MQYRSLPRKKTGLALYTLKKYIKTTSQCLILYQDIVGELYTVISEGKFTQSSTSYLLVKIGKTSYNNPKIGFKDFR